MKALEWIASEEGGLDRPLSRRNLEPKLDTTKVEAGQLPVRLMCRRSNGRLVRCTWAPGSFPTVAPAEKK
ncbi:hypothetical protein BO94DRAFT_539357 [Aspergillus sclerotioniger CBS 115572]|uniref:Uncharacterized protein n=1 Tax=Aspergillus sclerotioniger CBS 115572 TaxID=1450535 RepID=A0A317VCY8_9EURO|nr:hypothetical protein BO94DRAFT_539357 [Aspergillus sclerotioniger CBS 115572]PWY72234.1 hypothetical protein BO94DRAFT_539357 [Aspergillus sclerotioniger CBS 115572]